MEERKRMICYMNHITFSHVKKDIRFSFERMEVASRTPPIWHIHLEQKLPVSITTSISIFLPDDRRDFRAIHSPSSSSHMLWIEYESLSQIPFPPPHRNLLGLSGYQAMFMTTSSLHIQERTTEATSGPSSFTSNIVSPGSENSLFLLPKQV